MNETGDKMVKYESVKGEHEVWVEDFMFTVDNADDYYDYEEICFDVQLVELWGGELGEFVNPNLTKAD